MFIQPPMEITIDQLAPQNVPATIANDAGIILIGRNEGARLEASLASIRRFATNTVYVDSGSTDESVEHARQSGVKVVELSMEVPFTAARARNAGYAALKAAGIGFDFVQFVDGDCVIDPDWIVTSTNFLLAHPDIAVACGRRREKFPLASIYNRLCDWEWNTPLGKAAASGGDAMVRVSAFESVGGFREDVIAAEDDEFCVRLGRAGWGVWRLDAEMTLHDANMTRFGQWWRRAERAGHGFAQVGALHPAHFLAQRRRMWLWGAILPLVAVLGLFLHPWITLGVALLYLFSCARSTLRFLRQGFPPREALLAGLLLTLSKFCNLKGALTYWVRRARGRANTIIEYK
ncbi:GT2 family glycosyltransferase [Rhizobium rosettiformans]|uniref:GT2 family glycosyltransferase n=2 Tax=Rhizobium rosettiformans TaxID=1368430 RepID=A0A7W8ME31_9HYPH|nr:glycosyltransferase [Rhizobium rosettiformans]MBB5277991.1 GT2 family glycosyltransferase [Rhizobium rosettiformans]